MQSKAFPWIRPGRQRQRQRRSPALLTPPGICMQTPAAAKAAPHADAVLPVAPGRPESSVTAASVAAPPPPPSLPLYTCTYTLFVPKYKKIELDITFLIQRIWTDFSRYIVLGNVLPGIRLLYF